MLITSGCKFLSTNFAFGTVRPLNDFIVVRCFGIRSIGCEIQNGLKFQRGRKYSSTRNKEREQTSVTKLKEPSVVEVSEKVKQATKDASYLGIIVIGVGVTGLMFYAIFRELFSGHSSNTVYSRALARCRDDGRITNLCGEPIKGYGETNRRGRRRYVSHVEYVKDGINHMRMKFYIEGSRRKGTVHLEVKEDDRGKYEYRYLFVELDGYPKETIVLEDNRLNMLSV